jgi:hypothetical protein
VLCLSGPDLLLDASLQHFLQLINAQRRLIEYFFLSVPEALELLLPVEDFLFEAVDEVAPVLLPLLPLVLHLFLKEAHSASYFVYLSLSYLISAWHRLLALAIFSLSSW